jgi:hypothetical protein
VSLFVGSWSIDYQVKSFLFINNPSKTGESGKSGQNENS